MKLEIPELGEMKDDGSLEITGPKAIKDINDSELPSHVTILVDSNKIKVKEDKDGEES